MHRNTVRGRVASAVVAVLALAAALSAQGGVSGAACKVDAAKELWIRDLSVIDDPVRTTYVENPTDPAQGAWTFGRLMEHMAGPHDVSDFVIHLLEQFETDQEVNGFTIPGKPGFRAALLQPWIDASPDFETEGLDFTIAPFRLLGIVNRLDLRVSPTYGPSSAGEGRILFNVFDLGTTGANIGTFILEYELLADDCDDVKEWAERWHALGELKFGKAFNEQLQLITDAFAGPGVAPGNPNGSAIRQVRSNELISDFPWQWREFHLSGTTGFLEQGTVAQTPQSVLNGTQLFADYVNEFEAVILAGEHVVPETYQGQSFLGGSSDGQPTSLVWDGPGIDDNDARHLVAVNTCVGCHTQETLTPFFHATPRNLGAEVILSEFLTGSSVQDPVDPDTTRRFADIKRRVEDLCFVLDEDCAAILAQKPLNKVH